MNGTGRSSHSPPFPSARSQLPEPSEGADRRLRAGAPGALELLIELRQPRGVRGSALHLSLHLVVTWPRWLETVPNICDGGVRMWWIGCCFSSCFWGELALVMGDWRVDLERLQQDVCVCASH